MGRMKSWLMDQEERGVEVDKWPEMREMLEGTGVDARRIVTEDRFWDENTSGKDTYGVHFNIEEQEL